MPGLPELLVILVIVLIVFGANKLPSIGDALGRSIKNFKRASAGEDDIEVKKGSGGKAISGGKAAKELDAADEEEDEEWEEVVVRRKKSKKDSAAAAE
jgi:sec-independent protein translocase protein TatA